MTSENYFGANPDLGFYYERVIDWDRLVPLYAEPDDAHLLAGGLFNLFARVFPFLPGFWNRKAGLLIEVLTVRHGHAGVEKRHRHPTAIDLVNLTNQVIPAAQLFPQIIHEVDGLQVIIVQLWLTEEEKDDVVSFPGFLLLGHFDVGITVWDEIDFHLALIFLPKIFCHLPQILV